MKIPQQIILLCIFVCGLYIPGCGSSESTQSRWQSILKDSSKTNDEKLIAIAKQMFDCQSVSCNQSEGRFQITLVVNGVDPTVVVKAMTGKDNDKIKTAQKQLQLRNLISQLANFVHYTRSQHLGTINVEVMVQDVLNNEVQENRSRAYQLELEPAKFDEFLTASKLSTKEAIAKSESSWKVVHDSWK